MSGLAISSVISALLLIQSASSRTYKSSDDNKLYRVIPTTEEHLNLLKTLERWFEDGVTFLSSVGALNVGVDVMVSPATEAEILVAFQEFCISYEILTAFNWTSYHRLDKIYNWLDEIAETYPKWVEVLDIGSSYEGRSIKGVKITFNENNPGIFVEGGLHAREWISPAFVTYLINEIVSPTNEEFEVVARAHTWSIFPNLNPDGYEFTHTVDRLWRKTRQPFGNFCIGADPNRNWDFQWLSNDGASDDPCSTYYAGPKPFSEVEMKALVNYVAANKDQFYIYLSIHNYGQKIMLPYGYTSEHLDNYNESMFVATKAAEALANRYGTQYDVGTVYDVEYQDCGSSTDYVKGVFGTRFVYCYELRDNGPYYFSLPPEEIIPVGLETIDSLAVLIREARNLAYTDTGEDLKV